MVEGLIGKKLGMTQVFDEDGNAIPVTIIQAGPCIVVQKKTLEKEGYDSVQLGLVEKKKRYVTKPVEGHFKKAGVPPTRLLREFSFTESKEDQVNVGDVETARWEDVELAKEERVNLIAGSPDGRC